MNCWITVWLTVSLQFLFVQGQIGLVLLLNTFGSTNCVFLYPAENQRAGRQDWLAKETNKGNRGKGTEMKMDSFWENICYLIEENSRKFTSSVMMLTSYLIYFLTLSFFSSFLHVVQTPGFPLVFVPLFVFLFSIYSLALIKVTVDPHQVRFSFNVR